MANISFRLNTEDEKLVREYVSINNLNLSEFVRETILEKIGEDLELDETRIFKALQLARKEKQYDHTEVWDLIEAE